MRGTADWTLTRLATSLLGTLSRKGERGDAGGFGCYQGPMTAAEGTRRLGFGARFPRAAALFLGASPQREFPLG